MKTFIDEFKDFILKGNVIDLAVAFVIGGAFKTVVSSFVKDIVMPLLGLALGRIDFSNLKYILQEANGDVSELAITYGHFIQTIVDFLIIGFAIFVTIKSFSHLQDLRKKEEEEAEEENPPEPSNEEKLLSEIRDLLKTSS